MTEKDIFQAEIFENRIRKNFRILRKQARRNRVSCFRIYDRDIPEIPVTLDLYEFLPPDIHTVRESAEYFLEQSALVAENNAIAEQNARLYRRLALYLYERPYRKPDEEEAAWLELMTKAVCAVCGTQKNQIAVKVRKKQKGKNQYERAENPCNSAAFKGIVQEQGNLFEVNLADYLDTGLFFDHRMLRSIVCDTARQKRVLNLFCYTGSFSVYAASGGAAFVESVDLSGTYLAWAARNMELNGFSGARYAYTRSDTGAFLDRANRALASGQLAPFDLIILDPPTFSNSKKTQNALDINRSWSDLVNACIPLLSKGGILYFSTNSRRLKFDVQKLSSPCISVDDFTERTTPFDCGRAKPHRCWRIQKNEPRSP